MTLSLALWTLNAHAYGVTPPLPAVPTTTPVAPGTSANAPKTQALIDQLFDKADYQDFTAETPQLTK